MCSTRNLNLTKDKSKSSLISPVIQLTDSFHKNEDRCVKAKPIKISFFSQMNKQNRIKNAKNVKLTFRKRRRSLNVAAFRRSTATLFFLHALQAHVKHGRFVCSPFIECVSGSRMCCSK